MQPDEQRGICPLCGDPNSYQVSHCRRCRFLLPWAPERAQAPPKTRAQQEPYRFYRWLESEGFLPTEKVRCRFCNEAIEAEARQCPSCQRWLVEAFHTLDADPWQPDFNPETLRRVDTIQPRGCLAAGPMKLIFLFFFLQ